MAPNSAPLNDRIASILSELTEFINDGIAGYDRAARESANPEFQNYYRDLADQRRKFADELNMQITRFGGIPERDTTIKGKFYRQWMDLKAAFAGSDERAILDSNIYGEEWAQKAFNDALDNYELPDDLRTLIERQRQLSLETYSRQQQMKVALPA